MLSNNTMDNLKKFSLIVAINNDALIGIKEYGGYSMPWPMLKEDMDFFRIKTTTTHHPNQTNAIIVGYNTWQTLPPFYKKNNKRTNIVVSRTATIDISSHNEVYVPTFDAALELAQSMPNLNEIFVIGGAVIYDIAMSHQMLDKMYVTHINHTYPNNIVVEQKIFFPLNIEQLEELTRCDFLILSNEKQTFDANKNISYCFKEYNVQKNFHEVYHCNNLISKIPRCINYDMVVIPIDCHEGEYQYLNLIKTIMKKGIYKTTRNDVTKSIFGYQLVYDLANGYPLSTVKRSYPKAIFEELMWMIRGQTNVKYLQEKNVTIWNKNSTKEFLQKYNLPYEEGDIGPGYGFQMRHYGAEYTNCMADYRGKGTDQLMECIDLINKDPHSRRIIIDLWNPRDTAKMALPPCHIIYNFGVDIYDKPSPTGNKGKLNCHLFQRSWDVLLGWNTTTAALLTYLLANHCDLDPGVIVHSITDAHLYKKHIDSGAVDKLLNRIPRNFPTLKFLNKKENIEDYEFDDLVIENYYPCPAIIAEMVA
ncbi:bifunctional dihydrofolate reductase-thymidylate synthase [Tupanvirus soda lake]|uniref:Bifunctional dihydrofolate reductase-thymidylate synthase n=1 Tax=Tupanvirus deep ocean TaxID=2126984 RepID=A0A2K9L754_9VIRU|nr:bifunctional dihydrofolate reductase-thymidylate synthase [Tupanvirus soda lake]AUL78306.2 bifunctional dihydrofolate reductase-thymidylate synthase [Tupanvirus soda lake]